MGSTEILYDNIERYLDGSMLEAESKVFEAKMSVDETLRMEVDFHRELANLLSDSPEDAFRANLTRLSSQMKEPPTGSGGNWKYLLAVLPILFFAGWWFSTDNMGSTSDSEVEQFPTEIKRVVAPQKNIEPTQPDLEGMSPEEIKEVEKEANRPVEKISPEKKPTSTGKFAERKEDKNADNEPSSSLIASADFDPNPSLEFLIENNMRGGEITFEIEKKTANLALESENNAVEFHLTGTLASELDLYKKDFNLHIFSNKKADYQNFLPIFTGVPELDKTSDNTFKVEFKKAIVLQPGLYYYLFEDAETEELFFVEKFEVN